MCAGAGVAVLGLAASVVSLAAPGLSGAAAQSADELPTEGRFFEPVFDEMVVTEDIVYGEAVHADGVQRDLHLDLYEPAGDTVGERPVLVLLHGGYLAVGDHKSDVYGAGPGVARGFVEMGYVVASVQYRLRPDMGFFPHVDPTVFENANLDAYDDVTAAIGWLRANAVAHRLDPDAVVPFGFSAGGGIAWNLAWMPGSGARPGAIEVPAAVSVAGGPFETSQITGEPLASPTPGDASLLAYHGDADAVVDYALAAEPCGRAASADVRCDLVTYAGVGHPSIDPAFVPLLVADVDITTAFLAEEVLVPLGHLDAVSPPTTPPPPDPPPPPPTPPTAPGGPTVLPTAGPARPVAGAPDYTG